MSWSLNTNIHEESRELQHEFILKISIIWI